MASYARAPERHALYALIAVCILSACSSTSTTPPLQTRPPSPPNLVPVTAASSAPAPASVQISQIAAPDTPAGGITVGSDGSVYLDAASNFLRYTNGGFTKYPYVSQFGQPVGALGGVNSLANAPNGEVGTIVLEGGAPPFKYATALSPGSGTIIDSTVLTAFADDGLLSVARGPGATLWVMGYVAASGTTFLDNGTVDVLNGSLKSVAGFGTTDVLNAVAMNANGVMYAANDPFYNSQIAPAIYRLNASGASIAPAIALPPASRVSQLAPGPDGAMWFTDSGLNKIGRISTGGTLTYYAVPTPMSGLAGITSGSDNALWFTETAAGKVGRIDMKGVVTEYPIPQSGTSPLGIAAGAPGACIPHTLYFTEANGLGKVTFHS